MNPNRFKRFRENAPQNDSRRAAVRAVLSLS